MQAPRASHARHRSSHWLSQQAPFTQTGTSRAQSAAAAHVFPPQHLGHVLPPQSTSVSSPFLIPSSQRHFPEGVHPPSDSHSRKGSAPAGTVAQVPSGSPVLLRVHAMHFWEHDVEQQTASRGA
jgi:hypothetical protein